MTWQSVLISAVSIVVTALISWVTERFIAWLNAKTKASKSNTYLVTASTIVLNVVKSTFQTTVQALKESGTFDQDAQTKVFESAKAAVLDQLTEEVKTYITDTYGSVETWLTNAIEAAIYDLKNLTTSKNSSTD
jgi:hypothetical protein